MSSDLIFDKLDSMDGPDIIRHPTEVDGKKWIPGRRGDVQGPQKADVMVVSQNPVSIDLVSGQVLRSNGGRLLDGVLHDAGFDVSTIYYTNAVKYGTYRNKKPTALMIKECLKSLANEIKVVQPRLIIALGATALQALCGSGYGVNRSRGAILQSKRLGPDYPVYGTWHPAAILRDPTLRDQYVRDFKFAREWLYEGRDLGHPVDYEVITTLDGFTDYLLDLGIVVNKQGYVLLGIDAEWEGAHPADKAAYMRTAQFCHIPGQSKVVKFFPEACWDGEQYIYPDPTCTYEGCVPIREAMGFLSAFLAAMGDKVKMVGHNIKSDGLWFRHYGADIAAHVVWDTMLVEHLRDNNSQLRLEDLTMRYTSLGRYDGPVHGWVSEHKRHCLAGYGAVPDSLLLPYGASDAEVLLHIYNEQIADKTSINSIYRTFQPRGEYPSLFDSVMRLQKDIYEMEEIGVPVDRQRFDRLTELYVRKRDRLSTTFMQSVSMLSPDAPAEFNFRSTDQVKTLLFGIPVRESWSLGLIPIKTTTKPSKSWEWVVQQPPEVRKHFNPSTDQTVLELLSRQHPLVKQLLNLRRVDQVVKNFLPAPDDNGEVIAGKGVTGVIRDDGKLHPSFNPTTDTGRMRSSRPNVQNWPKSSEGAFKEIFESDVELLNEFNDVVSDGMPVSMRTAVIPLHDGWILLEADYSQAEMFVTAGLSGDKVMMSNLTTPGIDLHDVTAIKSFQLTVLMPDGSPAEESFLLQVAADDMDAFEKLQKQLTYRKPDGSILTRAQFKKTLRVSAKAINFGILYGRGAAAIAMQIEADVGLKVAEEEIKVGLEGWRNLNVQANRFLHQCQSCVVDPGYVENAWGRRRYFRHDKNDETTIAAQKREAGNFPIQGTVADTMALALAGVIDRRNQNNMKMRVINQIHDSMLLSLPPEELEATKQIVIQSMSGVKIPTQTGPLQLKVDIDVFPHRWGVKAS